MVSNDGSSRPREEGAARDETAEGFLLRGGDRRTLSIDRALSLLANEWRRTLLFELRTAETREAPLDTIVDAIVADETRSTDGGVAEDIRKSVRISLLHSHVPRLEGAGVVEYDQTNGTLRYRGDIVLDAYLDVTRELTGR